MTKVYIEYSSPAYERMFQSMGYEITDNPDECDLGVFTGGEDVSPNLYGDEPHPYTHYNPLRDMEEMKIFKLLQGNNTPMVGICRGAQFLNVMSGGRMYQHVGKHTHDHVIIDAETGETIWVSSTHHQMMLPSSKGKVIAFSNLQGERQWFTGSVAERDVSDKDYEVVYYGITNCLCFQPHPEFEGYNNMRIYFTNLVNRLLTGSL